MAGFRRFEDIVAWQKARETNRVIYEMTANGDFSKDFGLKDQIRRASISIMANIAEGFGRHSDKEFANFLNIAHGSTYEVQSHLYAALDLHYIDREIFIDVYKKLEEICRMTHVLAAKLRN